MALAVEPGNRWWTGKGHHDLALHAMLRADYDEALSHLAEAQAIAGAFHDDYFANVAASARADIARLTGDQERARLLYRQVLLTWRDLGNLGGAARCAECLAFVAEAEGCATTAVDLPTTAVPSAQEISANPFLNERAEALCLHAVRLLAAASALRERHAARMAFYEVAEHQAHLAALRAKLGAARFAEAWGRHQSSDLDQLVTLALQNL